MNYLLCKINLSDKYSFPSQRIINSKEVTLIVQFFHYQFPIGMEQGIFSNELWKSREQIYTGLYANPTINPWSPSDIQFQSSASLSGTISIFHLLGERRRKGNRLINRHASFLIPIIELPHGGNSVSTPGCNVPNVSLLLVPAKGKSKEAISEMFIRPFSIPIIDVPRGGERFHPWNRYIVQYHIFSVRWDGCWIR